MEIWHKPVMPAEVLALCHPEAGDLVIDGTTGEGGHSQLMLQAQPDCHFICLDADVQIQQKARQRLAAFAERIEFVHSWFDDFLAGWDRESRPQVILLDLGISVFHYEESGRGFSFRQDEPLDMRLNPDEGWSAADWVNQADEAELVRIFFEYGEEKFSRRIARAIVETRRNEPFVTAKQLADTIWSAVPAAHRYDRLHPATRCFQALRIVVNGELERLDRVLQAAFRVLAPGGRLAVITFHSLEDRAVKTFFRELSKVCICGPEIPRCICGSRPLATDLTRKPIVPTEAEIEDNGPSRSAKLRGVLKLRDSRSLS